MNKVINPPRYAKNKVFVVVPKISLPIFIPEWNNSLIVNLGLFTCTSYKADDIAIEVSIILPISPMITIALDIANILIPES